MARTPQRIRTAALQRAVPAMMIIVFLASLLAGTAQAATGSAPATATPSRTTRTATNRALQDTDVCQFSVEVDTCNLRSIKEEVGDNPACDWEVIGVDLKRACRRARRAADQGTPLSDLIDEFEDQDVDNYFDGGTYWNENTGVVEDEAPIIEDIFDDFAQSDTVSFPSNIDNFANCQLGAVMCLWVRDRQPGDDNGNCARPLARNCADADPADNTDVCYADASRLPESPHVPQGTVFFPEDTEGDTHAHGFAWKRGSTSRRFKGNLLFYISMYDHLYQRGYVQNVPLAPMCGCLENMPSVTRADCTEVAVEELYLVEYDGEAGEAGEAEAERLSVDIEYNACDGETPNDLYSELKQLYGDELSEEVRTYLVGPEDNNEASQCPQSPDDLVA
eukprot:TRINITY_DN39422_c0_g1_i1.p1 TRINITY_DN39422_c0_g1~~TRINITY_DN39422_c0_g1_i1.p1  ORF type:complete len:430 (+),score=49.57 TRINITY_DN39422_c0_g1_i1:116-1291(+)